MCTSQRPHGRRHVHLRIACGLKHENNLISYPIAAKSTVRPSGDTDAGRLAFCSERQRGKGISRRSNYNSGKRSTYYELITNTGSVFVVLWERATYAGVHFVHEDNNMTFFFFRAYFHRPAKGSGDARDSY